MKKPPSLNDTKYIFNRRNFLKTLPVGAVATISVGSEVKSDSLVAVRYDHGVASGDPLQDRVIIWTRVTPEDDTYRGGVTIMWQVALDENFSNIVKSGTVTTGLDRDYTLKHDVTGLKSAAAYFYRFSVGDKISPTGHTRTLAKKGMNSLRLAVVSCSNYPWGYFNAYKAVCETGPYDAVLHLGDYIYEYKAGQYASENAQAMNRVVDPLHEIITLEDYRRRYSLYRKDPDLQEIHRKYPFICAWDDHEFANNSYATGAFNHNEGEGDWPTRRRAATKAYMEWLPIRVGDQPLTYRSFNFGGLATLAMLDTRITGRERPLEYEKDVDLQKIEIPDGHGAMMSVSRVFDNAYTPAKEITDPEVLRNSNSQNMPETWENRPDYSGFHRRLETEERSMIGKPQEVWLEKTLEASKKAGVPWQILGQQVIMSYRPEPPESSATNPQIIKDFRAGKQKTTYVPIDDLVIYNPDAWDGYQPARRRVFDMLEKYGVNPIVLTGDTHCTWAMSLTDELDGKHYGAEFGVTSITSPGRGERVKDYEAVTETYYDLLDHMAYANIKDRGFLSLTITEKATTSDWYYVSNIETKEFEILKKKSLRYHAGDCADGKVTLEDVS